MDAFGRLALRSPEGVELSLQARGGRLALEVGSLADLWRLRHSLPRAAGRTALAGEAVRVSAVTGLDCVVRLRDRTVASLEQDARPGWLSRILGLGPVRIYPTALLAGVLPTRRSS